MQSYHRSILSANREGLFGIKQTRCQNLDVDVSLLGLSYRKVGCVSQEPLGI